MGRNSSITKIMAIALFLFVANCFGYSEYQQDYNHPQLKWYTLETTHLKVHYFEGQRYKAEEIVRIAENLCEIYKNKYQLVLPQKTDVAVWDSDQPNGWAAPVLNMVSIDVHEFDFRLRGTHAWLKNVVTHEFAHLFSIRTGLKYPSWIPDIRFGYMDYPNEKIQLDLFHVISGDNLPMWFTEGTAQYESFLEGSDKWDALRDMVLRVSVLEDKLLTYDGMNVFSGIGLNGELAYNQGFSMVNYIIEKYGHDAITAMFRESGLVFHQSFKPVIKSVIGISSDDLYEEWKKTVKESYTRQIAKLGRQVYGKKLTDAGYSTAYPRWAKDSKEIFFVSNKGQDYSFRSLYKYSLSDTIKKEKDRIEMVLPGIGSSYSLTVDSKRILYITSKKRDKNRWPRNDIYLKEIKPKKKILSFKDKSEIQLTENLSVLYTDLSIDAKSVAVVKKHGACDYLAVMDIADKKVRYIFPDKNLEDQDSTAEINIYTPRISPDGQRIVFSYFDGKNRQIGLIDTAGTMFYTFFKSGFDDRDPSWSNDGEWIIFSSDRTGIFNLYKKNISTGQIVQLTNVSGGAFYPEQSPDGRNIAYINYDKDGFSLYLTKDTLIQTFKDNPISVAEASDSAAPAVFTISQSKYNSRPHQLLISPIIIGEEILAKDKNANEGQSRWLAGGIANLFDPLNKNFFAALFLIQFDQGLNFAGPKYQNFINPSLDKEFSLIYENRFYQPVLNMEFDLRTLHDQDRFWNEDTRDTTQLNYQISLMDIKAVPRYQLTENSKLHLIADYYTSSTNFYDLPYFPEYNYLKGWSGGIMWTYLAEAANSETNIAPKGMYLKVKLDHFRNNLIREGAFDQAFTIEDGLIKAVLDSYKFNTGRFAFNLGLFNPLYKKHSIGLKLNTVVIDRKVHSFFETGPLLKGYPFFKNRDSLYIAGNKAVQLEADYYIPLSKRLDKMISIIYFDQLFGMVFYEMGAAWNKSFNEMKDISYNDFLRSVGAEVRMECLSYNNYPLSAYFRTAYGMDNPDDAAKTRYSFGITFNFENWDLIDIPDYLSRIKH